jgi:hypothetical protein
VSEEGAVNYELKSMQKDAILLSKFYVSMKLNGSVKKKKKKLSEYGQTPNTKQDI